MGTMEDRVILNSRDAVRSQRDTSVVLGVVLAEHGTTFDRWVVLNALATGAVPPHRSRLLPSLAAALATGPAAVEAMIDQAEEAGLVRIVSAPSGHPGAIRAELTPAGRAQHQTLHQILRATIDLAAAYHVLEPVR
jgi:DNA-binding MarR family transcriptional regulator